ncbi:MAG: hypothetical protein RLZZ241_844 [Bacteroidota bacterium]|jgi:hypothetical protein
MPNLKSNPIFRFILFSCLLALFLMTSCNKDTQDPFANCSLSGPDFDIADISGDWTASIANYMDLVSRHYKDLVKEGGYTNLNIQSNGRFKLEIQEVGRDLLVQQGIFSFCDGKFYARFDDAPDTTEEFRPELTDTYFYYNGPTDYDYDGDGMEQRVIIGFTFVRP